MTVTVRHVNAFEFGRGVAMAMDGLNLPTRPGVKTVLDLNDGTTVQVEMKSDGSYYGTSDKFDFSAPSLAAMETKLRGWGARLAGYEHK